MRPGFMLGEVWNGLRRNLSMSVSIVLVTMVSMFLLGLGLLAQKQVETMKGYWYDRVQVSIYLCPQSSQQPNCASGPVTQEQKTNIKSQLDQMPEVRQVYFESEQQAFDRFKEQFRNSPEIIDNLKVGDIPQSYRVQLKDPSKFEVVASQFDGAPGVASVQDQAKVLGKLFSAINLVTVFAIGLAALMTLAAALLMVTTIRQVAFTRRREIGIMRLVGASNVTIRTPFILEVLIAGLVGTGLALALLWSLTHVVFNSRLNQLFYDRALIGDGDVWATAPWMLLIVVVLAVTTSTLTLWRHLRV